MRLTGQARSNLAVSEGCIDMAVKRRPGSASRTAETLHRRETAKAPPTANGCERQRRDVLRGVPVLAVWTMPQRDMRIHIERIFMSRRSPEVYELLRPSLSISSRSIRRAFTYEQRIDSQYVGFGRRVRCRTQRRDRLDLSQQQRGVQAMGRRPFGKDGPPCHGSPVLRDGRLLAQRRQSLRAPDERDP